MNEMSLSDLAQMYQRWQSMPQSQNIEDRRMPLDPLRQALFDPSSPAFQQPYDQSREMQGRVASPLAQQAGFADAEPDVLTATLGERPPSPVRLSDWQHPMQQFKGNLSLMDAMAKLKGY